MKSSAKPFEVPAKQPLGQSFAEIRKTDGSAESAHYASCMAVGKPMLTIRYTPHYAELQWDCITVHPDYDQYFRDDNGLSIVKDMFRAFQERAKGAPGRPEFCGSAFVGHVKRLLPTTARALAEDFYAALCEPLAAKEALRTI